jgi:ankyrin repeat protein
MLNFLTGAKTEVKEQQSVPIIIPDEVAFIVACEKGYLELAKDCVHRKNINVQIQNNAALCAACRNGHLIVVRFLIENGANIYDQGALPFFEAVRNNRILVINYLLNLDNNYRKLYPLFESS